jgi:hypothetical protein
MEKSIIDIQLMNRAIPTECKRQNGAYGGRFDYRTECLIVVNTRTLCEASKHPSGLVAIKRAISMIFHPKNPFAYNNISTRRPGH